eukprot:c27930_g1_i1 orf=308-2929(+)
MVLVLYADGAAIHCGTYQRENGIDRGQGTRCYAFRRGLYPMAALAWKQGVPGVVTPYLGFRHRLYRKRSVNLEASRQFFIIKGRREFPYLRRSFSQQSILWISDMELPWIGYMRDGKRLFSLQWQQDELSRPALARGMVVAPKAGELFRITDTLLTKRSQALVGVSNGGPWIVMLHGLTISITVAVTSFLVAAKGAYAADTTLINLPLLGQSRDILRRCWPKFLQILSVFRDQGLLLSALLGLSAFFSMAETSITTLWPWKVRELAEKESEGGVFQMLRNDVSRFLTSILIGTTVANIAATALVTDAATALFGEAGVSAATGVMTVVILLLTEIAPKSIAVHNATEVARFVVRPVAWLSYVLYPVGRVVTALSMSMLKILGLKSSGEPFVTEEELKLMLRGAELSGAIEEEEQDMIENVLEIKDTYVQDVMTPLVDVVAIDASATLIVFRNLWIKHQYSRVPVFERRVDNIVGIAYAMDMLDFVEQTELLHSLTVGQITHKPAYFVPDSMSVWNLLREFQIRKVHMAIVLNEYGGSVGVVTLEDAVEEIVGEIFDENDSKEEIRRKTGYIIQRDDGVFDVDASTSIEDLVEALEVKIPEGPYHYETVSGFVCETFGYIPRTGENIIVMLEKSDPEDGSDFREGEADYQEDHKEKYQRYRLEVLAGNARKVGSVRFEYLNDSDKKDDGKVVTRVIPRLLRRQWEHNQHPKNTSLLHLDHLDGSEDKDSREAITPVLPHMSHQLEVSQCLVKDNESECVLHSFNHGSNEDLVSDGRVANSVATEHGDIDVPAEKHACNFDTNDASLGTLNETWKKHEIFLQKQEKKSKLICEAVLEGERQQKVDVNQREIEMETILHQGCKEQKEQGQTCDYNGT